MNAKRSTIGRATVLARAVLTVLAAAASITCAQPEPSLGRRVAPLTPSKAPGCSGRQWVVKVPGGSTCPSPPSDWTGGEVFAGTTSTELQTYCAYEYVGPPGIPSASALAALQALFSLEAGDPPVEDCVVVEPLASWNALDEWSRDRLLERAGALEASPGGTPSLIRVVIADTSPGATSHIPNGRSQHGYTMGWIAESLACPGGASCFGHVTTELALPHVTNDDIDWADGGHFGTRTQLAKAIYAAVEQWKPVASVEPRLIINLSVGWEPDMECETPVGFTTSDVRQDVVLAALVHAACHGAIVIAAAGNDPGGGAPLYSGVNPGATGPTCPAAWSTVPAPTALDCEAFEEANYAAGLPGPVLYSPSVPPTDPVDNPLLFAVGGIDYADQPITRSRQGGIPRLAAIALQAVAGSPTNPAPPALTGTSVAAAVTSGVAAAVWAYRPELTSAEVMDIVYRSGLDLLRLADFASAGVAQDVRRVSLCDAVRAACFDGAPHPSCPPSLMCPPLASESVQNPPLSAAASSYVTSLYADATTIPFAAASGTPVPPNVKFRSAAAAPWVHPQPDIPPCPACLYSPYLKTLFVRIDPTYPKHVVLSDMTLTLTGPTIASPNGTKISFAPTQPTVMDASTAPFEISGLDPAPLLNVTTATLSWKWTDTSTGESGSVTQQILLR